MQLSVGKSIAPAEEDAAGEAVAQALEDARAPVLALVFAPNQVAPVFS